MGELLKRAEVLSEGQRTEVDDPALDTPRCEP